MLYSLVLGLSVIGAEGKAPDARGIVDEIRVVLGCKENAYPFFAEYVTGLPAQPRAAGWSGTRRYFVEAADRLYYEEFTELETSKVRLNPMTVLFSYDEQIGNALCVGPVALDGATPERWLIGHGFMMIPRAQLDADLIAYLRSLLAGSSLTGKQEAGDLRTYRLSSRLGPLTVVVGPSRVEVLQPAGGTSPPKVLLHFACGSGEPPWIDAVTKLSARVDDPQSQVHRIAGDFTWIDAIRAANPAFDPSIKVLDANALAQLVRRQGYLLPAPKVAKILEAKSSAEQLHLKVESGGVSYEVSQYPKASRPRDDGSLESANPVRRKLGSYTVINTTYPNTKTNLIYYVSDKATMIVRDPELQTLKFEDQTLDRLIESFTPPSP